MASKLRRVDGLGSGLAEFTAGMVDHSHFVCVGAAACILAGGHAVAHEISAGSDRRASHDFADHRAWLLHLARRWSAESAGTHLLTGCGEVGRCFIRGMDTWICLYP